MAKVYVVAEIYDLVTWNTVICAVYPSTVLLKTAKRRIEALAKTNFHDGKGVWNWKEHSANEWNYSHEYYGHYYGYILSLMEVTK